MLRSSAGLVVMVAAKWKVLGRIFASAKATDRDKLKVSGGEICNKPK